MSPNGPRANLSEEVRSNAAVRLRYLCAVHPTTRAALEFASARHANQYREIDYAPFTAHLIEVAWLLDRNGQPDEAIPAGLLHDVLEKTTTTSAELACRFGAHVTGLVESVSDDPSISDCAGRKRRLRDRVAHADADTAAIFAADKISKVRELGLPPASRLHQTDESAKLAHYRASRKMLRRAFDGLALIDLLDAELNRIIAQPVPVAHAAETITTAERLKAQQPPSADNNLKTAPQDR
ncbi:MAG: HD domain-containing protein [Solirubrobacteraceae bacterium]